jgi:hypothetical protein
MLHQREEAHLQGGSMSEIVETAPISPIVSAGLILSLSQNREVSL